MQARRSESGRCAGMRGIVCARVSRRTVRIGEMHARDRARKCKEGAMFDLIIRNARIVDGTGRPACAGDVAVEGGFIRAVGDVSGPARETIDAQGLILAPGIVDTHTHYDAQVTWDPFVSPSPSLGVTTVIMGNCGFTLAPCRPADRDITMRNLTHVEGMSLAALTSGVRWEFETFPEYLSFLERRGVGVNVAVFVGHSSVRTWALRDQASKRAATPDEIAAMREVVLEALRAGAVGFSTTTSSQHNGEGGIPMPSRLADEDEMLALTGALGEAGRGVFMMTKDANERVPRFEAWAAAARRPFVIAALLHSNVTPEAVFEDLESMGDARARDHVIRGAVSACPLTMEFTLKAPYVFEGLRAWRPAMEAADDRAYRALLASADFRANLRDELARPQRRLFNGEWDRVAVLKVRDAAHAAFEGRSVAELAAEAGRQPFDWLLDLALAEDLETYFAATLLNSDEHAVGRLLTDPNALISLSDAGAHLEFLCDAGFAVHVLGHWVREAGIMSLEAAIHRMTGEPAALFGLRGRGVVAPGAHADLFLFDPATVGRGRTRRVNDLPAGASRLVTPAVGVHGVWVNGTRLVDENGPVANTPLAGAVLREFDA
ncbi:MAG: amidohydrolase family protein [Betaproteobacteria bacterium]|nr:amidohydrolase family protein [Betaproteobacteria bacterium]